ncbi:helix-turn-helix transcriptional regulator [Bacillus sp. GM2]|uniref:helix-turn-helix transcriptional regulator n=1 Tax=Bacillus TaxID=1386 RepID=UPI0009524899|nr:helix-turn-helix transcriptional regulator [Bacillus paralicheniformis]MSN99570.1 helix-turn-helix domain-containing protein [Bacillus paralicheniformis]MSO03578.1 helix-turn-helix domain-containing protein [Bacillus paralicheniformis]MSO07571.1 helix-turn-helix domain-containing protein [Bacillus paralicheniformis]MSO11565.1 helix-turn-helix domain-containing protein [Bacillus paralicheniformis]NJE36963.1 XRE family transcriptional regulator [Bacillus paralicheniformis]
MRKRLIEERSKKGWSQKQVSERLGLSEIYVRKIERGTRNPGRETMLKFEMLYSVPDRLLFPDLFQVCVDTYGIDQTLYERRRCHES